jgi:hypothetical protein
MAECDLMRIDDGVISVMGTFRQSSVESFD